MVSIYLIKIKITTKFFNFVFYSLRKLMLNLPSITQSLLNLSLPKFNVAQIFICGRYLLNFRWIDKMLIIWTRTPFPKTHFWSCDFSDWWKRHRSTFRKISQGYCIHLPNMKRNPPCGCEAIAKRKSGSGGSHIQTRGECPWTGTVSADWVFLICEGD